jgi:hypothetical protein
MTMKAQAIQTFERLFARYEQELVDSLTSVNEAWLKNDRVLYQIDADYIKTVVERINWLSRLRTRADAVPRN